MWGPLFRFQRRSSPASSQDIIVLSHREVRFIHFDNMATVFWTVGSLYGATSVLFGAFGAHGLSTTSGHNVQGVWLIYIQKTG